MLRACVLEEKHSWMCVHTEQLCPLLKKSGGIPLKMCLKALRVVTFRACSIMTNGCKLKANASRTMPANSHDILLLRIAAARCHTQIAFARAHAVHVILRDEEF